MNLIERRYSAWLEYAKRNNNLLLEELENMSIKDKIDAFSKEISFGTGGLRAIMGAGTNRLNEVTVKKCALGYSNYLLAENKKPISIVIAYDNRKNSKLFMKIIVDTLNQHGIDTYVFNDIRPTPELSFAIRKYKALGGVVITASHNPAKYNGIKMYDKAGCQCVEIITKKIKKYIDGINIFDLLAEQNNFEKKGKSKFFHLINEECDREYIDRCKNIIINKSVDFSKLTVLYTPQHGTGLLPVSTALKELGIKLSLVENQSFPSDEFINTKCPNPEKLDSFSEALKLPSALNADIIIGTDPDCDRIGVMVNKNNNFQLLTGNQIGIIMLYYTIKYKKITDNYKVYSTVVSSSLVNKICKENNIIIESTLTGFKNIGNLIGKDKYKLLLAIEESNGYLISDVVRDKDGVQAAILISEIAAWCKENQITLLDLLEKIYAQYGNFMDWQDTIDLNSDITIDKVMGNIRKITRSFKFGNLDIYKVEDYLDSTCYFLDKKEDLLYPKTNLLKIYFSDYSWVSIRPSGTEPKIKIYYCIDKELNVDLINIKNILFKYIK